MRKINDVEYTKTDLMKFFTEYSKCHDDEFTDFEKKEKKKGKREKNLFNLTLRPRLDNSSLTIESFSYIDNFKFANNTSLGFGVETEFILAFTNRRVSLLVEPTYQHFKGEKVIYHKLLRQFFTATIDYHSIMVPVGIRYYFPVRINSTLFADANFLIADLSPKTFIDFTLQDAVEDAEELDSFSSEIAPKSLFSIGVGYKYYNKYSVEIRYQKSEIFLYNFFEPIQRHFMAFVQQLGLFEQRQQGVYHALRLVLLQPQAGNLGQAHGGQAAQWLRLQMLGWGVADGQRQQHVGLKRQWHVLELGTAVFVFLA